MTDDTPEDPIAALFKSGLAASRPADPPKPTDQRIFEEVGFDQHAGWLRPSAALAALGLGAVGFVQMGRELRADRFRAAADEVIWAFQGETGRDRSALLPGWIWAIAMPDANSDFWRTGYLDAWFPSEETGYSTSRDGWMRIYDVRFDPTPFAHHNATEAVPPAQPDSQARAFQASQTSEERNKGGRPAGKDGEPIAIVTKRLLSLAPSELDRLTHEAVGQELIDQYRRLNLSPPSFDNARRNAGGILRAVRN